MGRTAPTSFDASTSVFAPRRKVELHHLSAKARQDLEASFQGELEELHHALANMDERICKLGDGLRAEAQARSQELYTKFEATSADMSSRCRNALNSAGEAKMRQQQ